LVEFISSLLVDCRLRYEPRSRGFPEGFVGQPF
jgi:hypothetical protein